MNGSEFQKVGMMSNTPFSNKCAIIGSLWLNYREESKSDESWEAFFTYNDIGLPLSYFLAEEYVTINEDSGAEEIIEETWDMLCDYIDVDPDGAYKNITEFFDASPNPPLEDNEENSEEDNEEESEKTEEENNE